MKPLAQNPRQNHVVEAQKDTGDWINEEYMAWAQNSGSDVLLLLSKAGSGKSTLLLKLLTKTLDDHNLPHLPSLLGEAPGSSIPLQPRGTAEAQETAQSVKIVDTEKIIVTSFFYSFKLLTDTSHKQMLASLLFQILRQDERLFSLFRTTYISVLERQRHGRSVPENLTHERSWTFIELKNIFLDLAKFRDFSLRIFVFVDAIDESEDTSLRGEILDLLTCAQFQDSQNVVIKSAIASRHLEFRNKSAIYRNKIILESRNRNDIERVVDAGLRSIKDTIACLDETERSEYNLEKFRTEILSRGKGVFLWSSLVLKLVESLIRDAVIPPNEMMGKLDTLPDDLEELYKEIVSRLKKRNERDVEKGKQWLKWVSFAERYLDIQEFAEAVTISWLGKDANITHEIWKGSRMRTSSLEMLQRALTSVCGGFLELSYVREVSTTNPRIKLRVQSDEQPTVTTVQFLHWTVKNFLEADKAHPFNASKQHGDEQITSACIQYLKMSLSSDSIPTTINLKNKVNGVMSWGQDEFALYVQYLEGRPLLNYALDFLPSHLKGVQDGIEMEMNLMSQILNRLRAEPKMPGLYFMMSWIEQVCKRLELKDGIGISGEEQVPMDVSQEYWKAILRDNISATTVEQKEFVGKFLTTALVAAATKGYMRTVKVLVAVGASGTAFDSTTLTTAVETAARFGHLNILNFLSQSDLHIRFGETELLGGDTHISGHKSLVSNYSPRLGRLPKSFGGPQNNLHDSALDLALQTAAQHGRTAIVRSLLEKGASLDTKDELGRSPIHLAALQGNAEAVNVFLNSGADADTKDIHGQTPLWQAAANGHEEVVLLLLEKGANPEIKDIRDTTPLSIALSSGHEAVVHQLLGWVADDSPLNSTGKKLFTVPFPKHIQFVGRSAELNLLDQILGEPHAGEVCWAALVGLGGIGYVSYYFWNAKPLTFELGELR